MLGPNVVVEDGKSHSGASRLLWSLCVSFHFLLLALVPKKIAYID